MSVNYTRINWEDSPSTQTPLNAENLNAMDSAIDELASAVNNLDGVTDDVEELQTDVGAIKNDLSEFPNGSYPQMGAGYANQLVSSLKKADSTPYNFRRVPYNATLEEVKKIVGGTIVNNQLVHNAGFNGISYWANFKGEITANNHELTYKVTETGTNYFDNTVCQYEFNIPTNHVVFIAAETYAPYDNGFYMSVRTNSIGQSGVGISNVTPTPNAWSYFAKVGKVVSTLTDIAFYWSMNTNYVIGDEVKLRNPKVIDITQDFGTTIADYVYSLETATAGAGVAWLKTHFPKQFDAGYQAYDARTLKSIEGLSGKKTVGFNQWDEEWEVGGYANATGEPWTTNTRIRSKTTNYIPILPNTDYCFSGTAPFDVYWYDADKVYIEHGAYPNNTVHTSPTNAHFMRFAMYADYGTTYNHDICINLSDPTKNGTYEPYEAHSYALDSDVVLRGIPKVDASGNLYYDGDEYLPDGTVNRRYGIVDLGSLEWTKNDSFGFFYSSVIDGMFVSDADRCVGFICEKYSVSPTQALNDTMPDKSSLQSNAKIYIKDTAYTDATAFKTAMSGVYLLYEKATATTETADPYTTPQIIAPDGTEEYIYTDGAFELPVGHSSDYPVDVSGQLDDILDTPSVNGTYTLKATVTDGAVAYSWVADA